MGGGAAYLHDGLDKERRAGRAVHLRYLHGKRTTNVVLQDGCPNDVAEHAAVAFDPVTAQHILNALDPHDARPVNCFALDARRTARD